KRADKRGANRGALPAHLPHVDVTIEPGDTNCPCCRAPMHVIGAETSKRLDIVPAQFRVIVTHRPKYACRACTDGVVQAPAPERLIKGGLPTEAMVAHVLDVPSAPEARGRRAKAGTSVKVSIATTLRHSKGGQFAIHAQALPGNPYDGHTLAKVIPAMEQLLGNTIERLHADAGYRGHNAPPDYKFKVYTSKQKRRVTP